MKMKISILLFYEAKSWFPFYYMSPSYHDFFGLYQVSKLNYNFLFSDNTKDCKGGGSETV